MKINKINQYLNNLHNTASLYAPIGQKQADIHHSHSEIKNHIEMQDAENARLVKENRDIRMAIESVMHDNRVPMDLRKKIAGAIREVER